MSPPHIETQSTDDEQELSDGGSDERESLREQYMTYRNKVKEFLEKPMTDHQSSTRAAATGDDDDDDDPPTHLLRVDRVEKSITANQLLAAFSRYGKVQWVRVFPGGYSWPSGSVYPYHSARICFDRTESVESVLADHQHPGCTINGVLVSFSKSKPGQWFKTMRQRWWSYITILLYIMKSITKVWLNMLCYSGCGYKYILYQSVTINGIGLILLDK